MRFQRLGKVGRPLVKGFSIDRKGYCRFNTRLNRGRLVHRVIWENAFGVIPPGFDIHHKDGNKQNNLPENLEKIKHGAHSFQSRSNYRKLSREQVLDIRDLIRDFSQEILTEKFEVCRKTIRKALTEPLLMYE